MAKQSNEEPKVVGAGLGGAIGGVVGVLIGGGPFGAVIGAALTSWLGHTIETEMRKND